MTGCAKAAAPALDPLPGKDGFALMSENQGSEALTSFTEDESAVVSAPLGGTRRQAVQRLQIGLIGLAAMILVVAMANIIMERAMESDATTVPEASATTPADPSATVSARDPLSDAGVVPELPSSSQSSGAPLSADELPQSGVTPGQQENVKTAPRQ
ncbi:MAG: hypothetical protein KDE63_04180 [Novosphingobium sp.]|nr:hypothetical protein [Novosphingobium sp.]